MLSRFMATGLLAMGVLAGFPATAAEPIVVGATISQTGSLADSAEHYRKGIVLWQEQINKAGGLLNRPVEFKYYDDKSDPATVALLTERLITDDKVDFLIAPFGSANVIAASAVSEKHGRVMINSGGSSEKIHERGFKYIFQTGSNILTFGTGVFAVAEQQGYETMAVVSRDYEAAHEFYETIKPMALKSNIKIVMTEYFPINTNDFSPYFASARKLNPDVWLSLGYPNEAIEIVRQMRANNYMPKMFVHNGVALEGYLEATGKDAEYTVGMSRYHPSIKIGNNEQFVKAFKEKWGYEPGYYAATSYAGLQVLQQAVEKTGSTDQEKLREALLTLETNDVLGPYKVDETGLQTALQSMIVQVLNGQWEIVWPSEIQSKSAVLPTPDWSKR